MVFLLSQMSRNHPQILAIRHHVEQMLFVRNETELVLVHVYQNTMEIHTQDAGQNVFLILIAIVIKLARTTDARILVREHVVSMPNVGLLTTLQLALVLLDILEIHWSDVNLKVSLSNQQMIHDENKLLGLGLVVF